MLYTITLASLVVLTTMLPLSVVIDTFVSLSMFSTAAISSAQTALTTTPDTLGVADEAVKLAEIYGTTQDQQKARVAGLLHDCAKDYPESMRQRFCKEYKVKTDEIMNKQTDLIHPFLGAEVAKREYQVMDEDVLNAIRFHTTGRPNMSLLEKIVFIADYIEPNREKFGGLDEARRLAYLDLDKAMAYILENTIEYVKARGRLLHPLSVEALEYYKNL